MRTPDEIRAQFERERLTVSEWARQHNFPPALVLQVLNNQVKGKWGLSREIAIKLGLIKNEGRRRL